MIPKAGKIFSVGISDVLYLLPQALSDFHRKKKKKKKGGGQMLSFTKKQH